MSPSPRRFYVLLAPNGTMTCLAVGAVRPYEYLDWIVVATVNRPLTVTTARAAMRAVVRVYGDRV